MEHKAGFVNIIGNPNVGKSTLINAFLNEKLSIVTPKAQTTRHRILGLVNSEEYQVVFSDTPGIIKPAYELQNAMMGVVKTAFEDADLLLYLIEIGEKKLKDEFFLEKIKKASIPVLIVLNKIDQSEQEKVMQEVEYWSELIPNAEVFAISALKKFNVEGIFNRIVELLPLCPPYFPKDQFTDRSKRFFVNEKIRERILKNYQKEIPYSVEVVTESFKEFEDIIRIRAIIYTERKTQKGILIGHKGKALKVVGTQARIDLQTFFRKKIFLELYVKVDEGWRNNALKIKKFGYHE
jgi:GTP-binding protein Era